MIVELEIFNKLEFLTHALYREKCNFPHVRLLFGWQGRAEGWFLEAELHLTLPPQV